MKAVIIFIVVIIFVTSLSVGNVYAVCSIGNTGASLCAGSDFSASLDNTNYQSNNFPMLTISGTPNKILDIKILDSEYYQKVSDVITIGQNGKTIYSFGLDKFSYGKYQVQVSDGMSMIKLDFTVDGTQLQKNVKTISQKSTLLIFTNQPWQANIQTSNNTIYVKGITNSQFSFTCSNDDFYTVSVQGSPSAGRDFQMWTVANLMQDGKMLNVGEIHDPNGQLTISGKCHVAQYPLSNNGLIYFTTDKSTYHPGDLVQISGYISQYLKRQFYVLTCSIQNSKGEIVRTDSAGFSQLNTFAFNIVTKGGMWKPDTYKIVLTLSLVNSKAESEIQLITNTQKPSIQSSNIIPFSFKTIVKDWIDGKITDDDFSQTVQSMVKSGTLKIPHYYTTAPSPGYSWIKSNAKLWLSGKMSNDNFANVLKYLNFNYNYLDGT